MSRDLTNSKELQERAKNVIPHLTGTFTRSAHSFVEGVYPVYIKSAAGSHFTDVDGNKYLFLTKDPQIYLNFKAEKSLNIDEVRIEIEYVQKGIELVDYLASEMKKNRPLQSLIKRVKNRLIKNK